MAKEKKTKWIVWYKHWLVDPKDQEFQESLEFTNWFEAVWYYIKIYQAFGYPKTWRTLLGFEIKMYHIKPDKK